MKDERIGTIMLHPILRKIKINDVREIEGYTLAYFGSSFCNMDILEEIPNEIRNGKAVQG